MIQISLRPGVAVVLAVVFWFGAAFLAAIRVRLAERFAQWVLPENQSWSIRIAQGLIYCAQVVGPSKQILVEVRNPLLLPEEGRLPYAMRFDGGWRVPEQVLGDWSQDLTDGHRIERPIRVAFSVMRQAFHLRLRNSFFRLEVLVLRVVFFAALTAVGLVALLLAVIAFAAVFTFGPPAAIIYGWVIVWRWFGARFRAEQP